jgi:hypothetical protein
MIDVVMPAAGATTTPRYRLIRCLPKVGACAELPRAGDHDLRWLAP